MKNVAWMFAGALAGLVMCFENEAGAGAYRDSAHGNSTYGVSRASTSQGYAGYARGNCAHCHEQHASKDSGAPSGNLLFYDNYVVGVTQTDGVCFKCHTNSGSVQAGPVIVNRSYSYRAGGWTADLLSNIKDAFSFTTSASYPSASSHNLLDIRNFMTTQPWKYVSGSNPCVACHDPHVVQGDPANSGNATKTDTPVRWMLSRPSQHGNSPVNLWGDSAGEKLSDYAAGILYQPPFKFGGGSNERAAADLNDFNTFCMDCHNSSNAIYSTLLGRNLRLIDWGGGLGDRHGKATANSAKLIAPYTSDLSYVLACTDCHEPHGSPNIFLTRREVNNGLVSVTGVAQDAGGTEMGSLCERCHGDSGVIMDSHSAIMGGAGCSPCHGSPMYVACINCHYHGSSATVDGVTYRSF